MLEKLYEIIANKGFWDKSYLDSLDIDDLLDKRDEKEFDSEWMRVFEIVQKNHVEFDDCNLINLIREKTFRTIFSLTHSSDLSGYISDDFELICKAYLVNLEDKWLDSFIYEYTKKRIPCGKLEEVDKSFKDLFENYLCEL